MIGQRIGKETAGIRERQQASTVLIELEHVPDVLGGEQRFRAGRPTPFQRVVVARWRRNHQQPWVGQKIGQWFETRPGAGASQTTTFLLALILCGTMPASTNTSRKTSARRSCSIWKTITILRGEKSTSLTAWNATSSFIAKAPRRRARESWASFPVPWRRRDMSSAEEEIRIRSIQPYTAPAAP